MAIICSDLRLLFVMVPGTGCSVVGQELINHCGGEYLPAHDLTSDGRITHARKHNTIDQLLRDGLLNEDELSNLLVIGTSRNPLDSFVTYYQRAIGDWTDYSHGVQERQNMRLLESGEITADQYEARQATLGAKKRRRSLRAKVLRTIGFNQWVTALASRYRLGLARPLFPMFGYVDVAIRYEQLEQGLNRVLAAVGHDTHLVLPRKNVTHGKRPFMDYYRPSVSRAVCRLLKPQMSKFGYPNTSDADVVILNQQKIAGMGLSLLEEAAS